MLVAQPETKISALASQIQTLSAQIKSSKAMRDDNPAVRASVVWIFLATSGISVIQFTS